MIVSRLHRLLGLAGIYARLDSLAAAHRDMATTVSRNGSRLANQENAMSKLTPILAAVAASLATITASQKKEADDVQKISSGMAQLIAGKSAGDDGSVTFTPDELTQFQGFSDALKAVADNSQANVDALDKVVAEIPTETNPTEPTGDPTAPSEPDAKPTAGEPAATIPTSVDADPSMASTIPDGMSQNG